MLAALNRLIHGKASIEDALRVSKDELAAQMTRRQVAGSSLWRSCQRRMKIPHFAGRKFPTPEDHESASLASDAPVPEVVPTQPYDDLSVDSSLPGC